MTPKKRPTKQLVNEKRKVDDKKKSSIKPIPKLPKIGSRKWDWQKHASIIATIAGPVRLVYSLCINVDVFDVTYHVFAARDVTNTDYVIYRYDRKSGINQKLADVCDKDLAKRLCELDARKRLREILVFGPDEEDE